jgi:trimeric autotransporter adhesin
MLGAEVLSFSVQLRVPTMMRIFLSCRRNLFLSASLLAAVLLAACGGGGGSDDGFLDVGSGNTLERLSIVQQDGSQPIGTLPVPRCIPTRLRAFGTFGDGSIEDMTLRVNWSSNGIVPVSNGGGSFLKGVVTPSQDAGSTDTIRIDFVGLSAQQNVSIQETQLELSALQSQLATGKLTFPLFLTGILGTPGSQTRISANDRVVWLSSNESLATVSGLGVVTPVPTTPNGQAQDVTITADTGIGAACDPQPSFTFKLHNKALTQVTLAPAGPLTMAPSTSRRFTAIGTYGDYSQDVTGLARYTATDSSNQTTTAVFFTGNLLSTLAAGQVNLKASLDQFGETGDGTNDISSNSVALTVTNATLTNFVIDQSNPRMIVGTSLPFTATGTFSDNSTQDLSLNVGWISSNTDIAAFSTTFGFRNLIFARQSSASPVTVTAIRSGFCDTVAGSLPDCPSTGLTTDATLASLKITSDTGNDCAQSPCSVTLGGSAQLRAVGTLAGGGTQELTEFVIWSVNNPATPVATVSNASGIAGRALGRNTGTVTVSARFANISASSSVVVQQDADGDGVPDANDQCANTPAGTPVNANGCPDSDGDGVQDTDDQCANTPSGSTVNAAGCPDSDGDTRFDNEDQCPMEDERPDPSNSRPGCLCDNPSPLPIGPSCLDS